MAKSKAMARIAAKAAASRAARKAKAAASRAARKAKNGAVAPACQTGQQFRLVMRNGKMECIDTCSGQTVPLDACTTLRLLDGKPTIRFNKRKCNLDRTADELLDAARKNPVNWQYVEDDD